MKRNRECLGKYFKEYSVRNGARDDIPLYSVTAERGFCRDFFVNKTDRKDRRLCRIVPRGCFAYNPSRINVGAVAWQRDAEFVIVSHIYFVFSVSDELDGHFLLYFLKSNVARRMMNAKMEGSVRPHLWLDMLTQITIPEMTLEEQRHCVEVLDKVQSLIALRRRQIEELDRLITARFIEMFGDTEAAQQEKPLSEIAQITPGRKTNLLIHPADAEHMPVPFVTFACLHGRAIDWSSAETREASKSIVDRFRICPQDILMLETGVREQLGSAAMVRNPPENAIYQSHLIRVRTNTEVLLPVYFDRFLQTWRAKQYFQRLGGRDTVNVNLNKRQLGALTVPLPLLDLQKEFAAFAERIESAKANVQKGLEEALALFEALTQEFFG